MEDFVRCLDYLLRVTANGQHTLDDKANFRLGDCALRFRDTDRESVFMGTLLGFPARLSKRPHSRFVVVLTLVLDAGANTTLFRIADAVLLRSQEVA